VALARFFGRVADAVGSVAPISVEDLTQVLGRSPVRLTFADRVADDPALVVGADLLANLAARLYPTLALAGPEVVVRRAAETALAINPAIELIEPSETLAASVLYGSADRRREHHLAVTAAGWRCHIDPGATPRGPANPFTGLAAACLAAAELFRMVFADALGRKARHAQQPGTLDLLMPQKGGALGIPGGICLPDIHLAGAGAIGQACLHALAVSGTSGRITVVDPELIELSNLQRYVLARDSDVGRAKVDRAREHLEQHGWLVEPVPTHWGADGRSGPEREVVLVALDSAQDRLGVAAGLHKSVFNAWTQPADLGWSRHEHFGSDPCLACLYYPDHIRPSDDEQIARALKQHRLRILSYFVTGVPVGEPLPLVAQAADVPPPPDADRWLEQPLVIDLVLLGVLAEKDISTWATRSIGDLYSEGICGGGILHSGHGGLDEAVMVPLAHPSALAGVMLALSAVAAHVPDLASRRPPAIEHRLDLMAGLPQLTGRPRAKTVGCICSDPDYLDRQAR
jgi:hypothetical protein